MILAEIFAARIWIQDPFILQKYFESGSQKRNLSSEAISNGNDLDEIRFT